MGWAQMKQGNSIIRNAAFLAASGIAGAFLSFLLLIVAARFLGPSGLGIYSLAMAMATTLAILADLGLGMLTTMEVARKRESAGRYLSAAVLLRVVVGAIVFALLLAALVFFNGSQEFSVALLALFAFASLRLIASSFKAVFRGYERMEYEALPTILGTAVTASAGILLMSLGFGLYGLAIAFLAGGAADLATSWLLSRKIFAWTAVKPGPAFLKGIIRKTMPFWAMGVLVSVYFSTDAMMISVLAGKAELGLYSAAYRLIIGPVLLMGSFSDALFPALSRHHADSAEKAKKLLKKSLKTILALSIPLSVFLMVFAEKIILLVYGSNFGPSTGVLLVLGLLPVPLSVNILLSTALNATNRQKENTVNLFITVVLNIAANYALITNMGFIGAAYAMLFSQCLFLLLSIYSLSKPRTGHKVQTGYLNNGKEQYRVYKPVI